MRVTGREILTRVGLRLRKERNKHTLWGKTTTCIMMQHPKLCITKQPDFIELLEAHKVAKHNKVMLTKVKVTCQSIMLHVQYVTGSLLIPIQQVNDDFQVFETIQNLNVRRELLIIPSFQYHKTSMNLPIELMISRCSNTTKTQCTFKVIDEF